MNLLWKTIWIQIENKKQVAYVYTTAKFVWYHRRIFSFWYIEAIIIAIIRENNNKDLDNSKVHFISFIYIWTSLTPCRNKLNYFRMTEKPHRIADLRPALWNADVKSEAKLCNSHSIVCHVFCLQIKFTKIEVLKRKPTKENTA